MSRPLPRAALALLALLALLAAPAAGRAQGGATGDVSRFAYDRAAPLALRDTLERVDRGIAVHRVSFASPKGGRATGFLVVPPASAAAPDGRFAGVVLLHGAPGDASQQIGRAQRIAQLGAVVLALDAPFARRDPRTPLEFSQRGLDEQVQLIVDLQRAVDVLVARADVDSARLGYMGGSYGGANGAVLAGVERRLKGYALATADGGLGRHFTDAEGRTLPAPEGLTEAQWHAWLAAADEVSSLRFVGRAAPARLLFQWGRDDRIVHRRNAEAVFAAASEPKEARWYDSGHALPGEAKDDAVDWLAGVLGMRALTAAERAQPPAALPVRSNAELGVR